jgi:ribosomal protein L7/L12
VQIFNLVEINLITKRSRIIEKLQNHGKIRALKECKALHGWDFRKSKKYVDKLSLKYPPRVY